MVRGYGVATTIELDRVVLRPATATGGRASPLEMQGHTGEMLLVRVPSDRWLSRLGDVLCGIQAPVGGSVRFLGEDWADVSVKRLHVMRSMVGRVGIQTRWIFYMSVMHNIILSQSHHTSRSRSSLIAQAGKLAVTFGLPGLPVERPEDVLPSDLRRAACVRAFMGSPWLIVLEEPATDETADLMAPLVNCARNAMSRGATVIWLTRDRSIWEHEWLRWTRRLQFHGGSLTEAKP